MAQYGFFIDLSRCTGCNACVIACKQWHDIPPGPIKWMRVYQWEKGIFPAIDLRILPIMCFHCENPPCAKSCSNEAIYKESKYGAVLVDPEKCKGERKCWDNCPYGAPQFAGDERGLKMSKCTMCIDRLEAGLKPICVLSCSLRALEFGLIDELKVKYGDIVQDGNLPKDYAPCRILCPIGIDVEKYIALIVEKKFNEAIETVRECTPFVGVLGRVCTHPCETDCRRGKFDDAVSIRLLKRFLADYELGLNGKKKEFASVTRKERIAVIGSGPAGLSCAYDLIRMGYPVTVFEAASQSGGLLRYGIPGYRLPREIIDREINYIKQLGVEIKTNSPVRKVDDIFSQGYKAIFIAPGAGLSRKLGIRGEDARGVLYALDFLKQRNMGKKINLGKKVIVVGGGSVAIDTARLALRSGAGEVHIICLECRDLSSRDRMLAQDWEIEEAEEEGVIIHSRLGISKILTKNGKVTALETQCCLSVYDENGIFAPKLDDCSTSTIEVDNVIVAIGQTVDKSLLPEKLYNSQGTISVNPVTLESTIEGVFCGGDSVTGPADVVSAIATGKEAAISIYRYLNGEDLAKGRKPFVRNIARRTGFKSIRPQSIGLNKRKSFSEVNTGFAEEEAFERASCCLKCGSILPSVVFRPVDPKKQVIPWDAKKALALWQKRHPDNGETLPDIFTDISEVMQDAKDIIGRNRLILKAKNTEELMESTMDDE